MNFQRIWISKGILAKNLSEKAGLGKHSYLKYALNRWEKSAGNFKLLWEMLTRQLFLFYFPSSNILIQNATFDHGKLHINDHISLQC